MSGFLEYFCAGMAKAFAAVRAQAASAARRGAADASPLLRRLDPRQRRRLTLLAAQGAATAAEIAAHLGISPRTAQALCRVWVAAGFLALRDPSRKNRSYRLAAQYEALVAEARR